MSVLVLGHRGYLGSYLATRLKADTEPKHQNYRYIVNCIGKPSLEYCEANPDISYVSNYSAVIPYCTSFPESTLINFSSYYVYDDEGECTEAAQTTDRYTYMKHKLMGEMFTTRRNGIVFRIGKLFGHHDLGKQNKLTEAIIKSKEIALDRTAFNPTSLNVVGLVVEYVLRNGMCTGVYNLSNSGNTTHFEYGQFIAQRLNDDKKISVTAKMPRVFHNYGRFLMSTQKLEKIIPLPSWQDDVAEYIKEIAHV